MRGGNKNPSDRVFWNDIENDENLKTCSLAAKGLWLWLLLPMAARAPETGVVMVGSWPSRWNGDLPMVLANMVGHSADVILALLEELVTSGTASIDSQGRLINRRMVKARQLAEKRSAAGRRGAVTRWQTDGKNPEGSGNLDTWQDHGKHHGKRDGKIPEGGRTVSDGNQREIPGLSQKIGCDIDSKAMPSSILSKKEGKSLTGERGGRHPPPNDGKNPGVPRTQIPPEFAAAIRARANINRPIPDGFAPTAEDIAWANKARPDLDDDALRDQTDRLVLKATAGGWQYQNWSMKWRAWIKDARLQHPRSSIGTQRTGEPQRGGSQARNRAALGAALSRLGNLGSTGSDDRGQRDAGDNARNVEATVMETGKGGPREGDEGA